MLLLSWLLSLVIVALLAYHYRQLVDRVKLITGFLVKPRLKVVEEPSGSVIDPDDPVQQIKRERDEQLKRMNPDA